MTVNYSHAKRSAVTWGRFTEMFRYEFVYWFGERVVVSGVPVSQEEDKDSQGLFATCVVRRGIWKRIEPSDFGFDSIATIRVI